MTKLHEVPKKWLTLDVCAHIFKNFKKRLERNEPIPPFDTRFEGKLEGILSSVGQTYGEKYLNPTILDVAAAYFNQIIRGHPFKNGNKRMAVLFTHFFLLENGVDYTLSYEEMFNFAIAVALGSEKGNPADITKAWCKKIITEFTKDK